MVGRPLSCDESTFSCKRLEYARVCVEVDAAHPFVHNFELEFSQSGDTVRVDVEYEWKPSRCKTCKVYGHCCKEVETQTVDVDEINPTAAGLERPQANTTEGQVSSAELDKLQNSNPHNPTDQPAELDKIPNSHNPTDHTATQPTHPSHQKKTNIQETSLARNPTPDDKHTQIQLKDKQQGRPATLPKTKSQTLPRGDSTHVTTVETMHADLDATTANKGKGHAQEETLVGKKATKSHENYQEYPERTESKMDSLQSQSQGTICSTSSSNTADSSQGCEARLFRSGLIDLSKAHIRSGTSCLPDSMRPSGRCSIGPSSSPFGFLSMPALVVGHILLFLVDLAHAEWARFLKVLDLVSKWNATSLFGPDPL
uniref:Uncharacterized protein n=1 Tax=Salix viminalis TaxID=40686 RepID=A0A6N2MT43_SALVM